MPPVTNRPRHNESKKQDKCDICVPLKTACMCVSYCSVCVQFSSSWAYTTACVHVSACVLHTSTHHCSRVEWLNLLTVMTRWRVRAFIFPLFYCKYSSGLQGNACRSPSESENTGRHLEGRRGGGEEGRKGGREEGRMKRVNVPLHRTAKMQLEWSVQRFWLQDLRLGFSILTAHSQQLCEVDKKS